MRQNKWLKFFNSGKRNLSLYTLLFFVNVALAQNFQWAKRIGGANKDQGLSVAFDASGNIYTTGAFQGTVDFDPGSGTNYMTSKGTHDFFISKSDKLGNFIWAIIVAPGGIDIEIDIAVDDSGNVYSTGQFRGSVDFDPGSKIYNMTSNGNDDIFILKLNPAGNFEWVRRMGGVGFEQGYSIALDKKGNVYSTGSYEGTVDFNPGSSTYNLSAVKSSDIYISKLDSDGNFVWAKSIGGTEDDRGTAIAVDASGNCYSVANFKKEVDFDPGIDEFKITSIGIIDISILKLDTSGNFVWAKNIGGDGLLYSYSIDIDNLGNSYTVGHFLDLTDFDPGIGTYKLKSVSLFDIFILKLNSRGSFVWAKTMGGESFEYGLCLDVDINGNIYSTGYFQETVDFDPGPKNYYLTSNGGRDIFISKLDSSGNFEWAANIGGTFDDRGNSIIVDGTGNVYIYGFFGAKVNFNPGGGIHDLTSEGDWDAFLLKINGGITEIKDLKRSSITISPNPVPDKTTITIENYTENIPYRIFNITGKQILIGNLIEKSTCINMSDFSPGFYFLEIGERDKGIFKILKQ